MLKKIRRKIIIWLLYKDIKEDIISNSSLYYIQYPAYKNVIFNVHPHKIN